MEIASTVYRQISREWSTKRNTLSPLCEGVPGAEVRKFPRRSWFPGRLDLADERKSSACHKSTQLSKKELVYSFITISDQKQELFWLSSTFQAEETLSYFWEKLQLADSWETGPPVLNPTIHKHRSIAPVHVPLGPAVMFLLLHAPNLVLNVRQ